LIVDIVLVAGLWLDASSWSEVAAGLAARGHRATAVSLPGQGDGNTSATLADQVGAVVSAVDAAQLPAMVVGHSAAASLAWLAVDARPDKIASAVFVGGFPSPDGERYADFFATQNGTMPFPGWEPFEGADSADLDAAARRSFESAAIAVPEGVTRGVIRLTDARRYAVPVTLVCPEFTPAQARKWIDSGELPELAKVQHLSFADIDSGHWPMITAPMELARLLAGLAEQD
jgi:pimeloyl-ACP methyl ester carboxylesterase